MLGCPKRQEGSADDLQVFGGLLRRAVPPWLPSAVAKGLAQLGGYQTTHLLDYNPAESTPVGGKPDALGPGLFVKASGVLAHDEVNSPSGSGQRAVLTDALDALATFDRFWEELLGLLRKPLKLGTLKDSVLEVESEREFSVTQVLDGKMLDKKGKGRGSGQDDKLVTKFVVHKDQGRVVSSQYSSAGALLERNCAVLHRSPLRLEWWGEMPGERRSGPVIAAQTRARAEEALRRIRPGEDVKGVQVNCDVCSPPSSKLKKVISCPLDHLADFDSLWQGWIDACRDGPNLEEKEGDNEFCVGGTTPEGQPCVHRFRFKKAIGEIYSETHSPTSKLLERRWVIITRTPLQVESWAESPGERRSGKLKRSMVQNLVDTVVGRICGTASKVRVYFDMASPGSPGLRSIVSESMSGRLDFDTLWDAWVTYHKSTPGLDRVVKKSDLADVSDFEFKVSHTLDQEQLDASSSGKKLDEGFVQIRYVIDEAAGSVFAETYGRSGRVRDRNWGVLHRKPFAFEWWGEHPGARKTGLARENMLQSFLDALASRMGAASAPKAHRDSKSPSQAGLKSVVSDPLGQLGDFGRLWGELVALLRTPPNMRVERVKDHSPTAFDLVRRNPDGKTSIIKCEVFEARRLCVLVTQGESGRIFERDYIHLRKEPFVLEWWGEERGERRHGPLKAQHLQALLNAVIERLHPSPDGRPTVTAMVSVPSVASPNKDDKSVLSEPLDKVGDWRGFWQDLLAVLKQPLKELVPDLRMSTLDEVSASEFWVTQTTEPPALQYIVHCKFDKSHGVFSAETSGNDNSEPEKTWALFYKEPLMIECWGEQKIARGFGAARCEQIKAFLDTIVKRVRPDLGRSGVQVTSNEKLRCAVSGPLDKLLSFDRLWNELVELLKRPQTQGVLKEATLKVASDSEFTVVHTLDGPSLLTQQERAAAKGKGKGTDDVKTILKYRIDKSKGEVYRDCYRMAGGLIDRGWIMVRTKPLRVESWTETPGLRLTGHDKARQVQDILDGVVGLAGAA